MGQPTAVAAQFLDRLDAIGARLRSAVKQVHANGTQTSRAEDVSRRRSHTGETAQPAPAAKATTSSGDQRA